MGPTAKGTGSAIGRDMERIRYMDMLDYRAHYAVVATEDRARSRLHERSLLIQLRRRRGAPVPHLEGRGRWSVVRLASRLALGHNV
jgi:hypothetical protein